MTGVQTCALPICFIINKKYPVRPTFENDTEIVEAFTEYDLLLEKIKVLKNKIALI